MSKSEMGISMKTLYVSDLDGTLLQSNETLSEYTVKTINELVEQGMIFSYATAGSYITARKVTEGHLFGRTVVGNYAEDGDESQRNCAA